MKSYYLPMPPSTNALYRNRAPGETGSGRKKTEAYRAWVKLAGQTLLTQGAREPVKGWFDLKIVLHSPTPLGRIDADNVKAVADFLKLHGIIEDDTYMASLKVCWAALPQRGCTVTVVAGESPWKRFHAPKE